jgi:prepilin-type N-terminal cleavage/methylation domain-containing protein
MNTLRFVRRGFTIVELMVSISVIALLATFTVPTYQLLLSQQQLNSAVDQTSDLIRYAAQRTVTEQVVYGFTVSAGSTSIVMFQVNSSSQNITVQTMALPSNIQVGTVSFSGNNSIRFSTAGAPTTSGSFTLTDTVRGKSRTIEVRPSGNVRTNTGEQ